MRSSTAVLLTLCAAKFDGLAGLAFDSISADHVTPFWYNIISQHLLTKNQFAFYLSPHPTGSELMLGDVDSSKIAGPINYVPLTNETYWEFALDGVKVGTQQLLPHAGARAICDSGTSLLAFPLSIAAAFNAKIGAIPSPSGAAVFATCPK